MNHINQSIRHDTSHRNSKKAIRLLEQAIHDEFGLKVHMGAELEYTLNDDHGRPIDLPGVLIDDKTSTDKPKYFSSSDLSTSLRLTGDSNYVRTHYAENLVSGQYEVVFDHQLKKGRSLVHLARAIEATKSLIARKSKAVSGGNAVFDASGGFTGNSLHINFSLCDDSGHNILNDVVDKTGPTIKADVIGPTLLPHMANSLLIMFPNKNSLERIHRISYLSPSKLDTIPHTHDLEDTAAITPRKNKKTEEIYLENRLAGADVDPYLVIIANLVAIYSALHRIKQSSYQDVANQVDAKTMTSLGDITEDHQQVIDGFDKDGAFVKTLNQLSENGRLGDMLVQQILHQSQYTSQETGTSRAG